MFTFRRMVRVPCISIGGWQREGVTLPHVLKRRKVLKIPRNMKAAHNFISQWDDVVNMMAGGTGEINLFDHRIIAGEAGLPDVGLPHHDVISVALGLGSLPSSLGLEVAIPIGSLPSLGSFVCSGSGGGVVGSESLFYFTAGRSIVLLPVSRASVSAFNAGSVAGLPLGIVPVDAGLSAVKSFEASLASLFACDDVHQGSIQQMIRIANGEFIFRCQEVV